MVETEERKIKKEIEKIRIVCDNGITVDLYILGRVYGNTGC